MSTFTRFLCCSLLAIVAAFQPSAGDAQISPSSRAIAGNAVRGVDLALSAQSSRLTLGTPININLEIQNHANTVLRLRVPQLAVSYNYVVIDRATGKQIPLRVPPRSGVDVFGGFDMHVRSGESYVLAVRLDDLVQLDIVGSYSITVSTINVQNVESQKDVGLTSNTITIDILPRHR